MEIIERKPLIIVGLPVRAHWKNLPVEVPRAWKLLFDRNVEIEHRSDSRFVEVSLEVQEDVYLELVGAPVSHVESVPEGMWAVRVAGGSFIHYRHEGPVVGIADSFGKMYRWAAEDGHPSAEFKIDIGYTLDGQEESHDLYVALTDSGRWERLDLPVGLAAG